MNCPNCGTEMKDESSWSYGIGSWDMDYPDVYHEVFRCRLCRINKINGNWEIPDHLTASPKQIKCAEVISRNLGIDAPEVPLKTILWKFIHDHMEDSKRARDQAFSDWCEENSDWLPEYF